MKTRFPFCKGFAIHTMYIVVLFALVFIGCQKKETTVQAPAEDLMDPAVMPQVVHTYPPGGGVGPFNVYAPTLDGCSVNDYSNCPLPGHFFLQFNKMIMTSTMVDPNIRITGGTKPASVRIRGYNTLPLQNTFELILVPADHSYNTLPYEVGTVYTVTVGTGVIDGNGNHLVSPYSFSFTPEPSFRMLQTIPLNGDSIAVDGNVMILFNSPVDRSILQGISMVPPVPGGWYTNSGNESSVIVFSPTHGFLEESEYTVTLADSSHDVYGNRIEGKRSITFRTYPFRFLSSSPRDGDVLTRLDSPIYIYLTGPPDPDGLAYGMNVDPPLDGFWADGNYIVRNPTEHDLKPLTRYQISLTSNLRGADATYLQNPSTFRFSTPPFGLVDISPDNNESVIGRATPVQMHFNGRFDTSTVASAFSINPPVAGHFLFNMLDPTQATFMPDDFYIVGTKYTVIVRPSVRSIDGYYPVKPDTSYFIVAQ